MRDEAVKLAEQAANRFLQCASTRAASAYTYEVAGMTLHGIGVKESGALRRASMDLTRALAEMRKP